RLRRAERRPGRDVLALDSFRGRVARSFPGSVCVGCHIAGAGRQIAATLRPEIGLYIPGGVDMPSEPVSVVVRRRAKPGAEADFERAMQELISFPLAFPGNRGIDVLRPQPGGSREYTVVDHFVDSSARKAFKEAPDYRAWMTRLRQLTEEDPYMEERDGLGGWFTPPEAQRPSP